jgi:FlaA1/EpsC-like NDP-sugar epimerase
MIKNKRILVTGGSGSIGSELVRQLAPNNKIFILDINETATFDLRTELKQKGYWVHSRNGDVKDASTVADVFEDFKPQIVFHAAALKHVTPCEEYPLEAIQTNILGTYNVMSEAKNWECLEKFVFISTDKVVNANCIMGITKLCAEGLIKRAGKEFVAVRFGNVMGSRGSVIPIWQKQFDNGEPITVTDEKMERYMMTIPDACELVIKAAEMGKDGEVFILQMGQKVNVLELATEIVKKSGSKNEIKVIGKRPGETLDEKLMTHEELSRARLTEDNRFWII